VVTGPIRVNFDNAVDGTAETYGPTGGNPGEIQINNGGTVGSDGNGNSNNLLTGATISNLSNTAGGTITANIHLNAANASYSMGDVTQSFFNAGTFTVTIGGTPAGFGLTIGTAGSPSTGVIYGNSNVNLANGATGGGSGNLTLNGSSTYTGSTSINVNLGTITLGTDNALPLTTDVIVGTIKGALTNDGAGHAGPILDLNGHNQQIASLSDGKYETSIGALPTYLTITNNVGSKTLTISGSANPANPFSGYITDGSIQNSNGATLTLAKAGSNTLILAKHPWERLHGRHNDQRRNAGCRISNARQRGRRQHEFDGSGPVTLNGGTLASSGSGAASYVAGGRISRYRSACHRAGRRLSGLGNVRFVCRDA